MKALPPTSEPSHFMICPDCDLAVEVEELHEGELAKCPRCGAVLMKIVHHPYLVPVLNAAAALVLMIAAELLPFMTVSAAGTNITMQLHDVATALFTSDYRYLGYVIYSVMQLIPAFMLLFTILIFAQLRLGIAGARTYVILRAFSILKEWSMVEVFLVAVLVSLVKVLSLADVKLGMGFFAFILYVIFYIRTVSSVDERWIWDRVTRIRKRVSALAAGAGHTGLELRLSSCPVCGEILPSNVRRCPRCGSKVIFAGDAGISSCVAFLIAACIMYVHANVMPIMVTETMGSLYYSTVMDGIIFMWTSGSYPVAAVIFIASVFVPVFKIAVLTWLCISVRKLNFLKKPSHRKRIRLYRVTEFIGRWSMVDVFVVAFMAAYFQMGTMFSIFPGVASMSFCAVVILTMLAANSFDPRLIWNVKSEPEEDVQ